MEELLFSSLARRMRVIFLYSSPPKVARIGLEGQAAPFGAAWPSNPMRSACGAEQYGKEKIPP